MVRALVSSTLLLSALGTSAGLLAPGLFALPDREVMVVRGSAIGELQQASLDGEDCFPPLLLGEEQPEGRAADVTVLELRFLPGPEALAGVRGDGELSPGRSVTVVLDATGQVLAAGPAESVAADLELGASTACLTEKADRPGVI